MPRYVRWLAPAALGVLALSASLWGPPLLRRAPWFEVRRVEVSGTRLLAPHAVLAASGIGTGQSVWDDPAGWERALSAHPAVAEARVTRRLPSTLRVRIREKQPVAFVEAETLRPATAAGEILPLDPARSPMDLPIVRSAWPDAGERIVARRLLAEAGRLARLDPGLLAEVSELRAHDPDARVVILTHRLAEVVIPAGLDAARIAQLRAVLADLERRPGAPGRTARVDLRFRDQVVVRLSSSA